VVALAGSRKVGVAVVPGSAFSLEPTAKMLRFSCAVDLDAIEVALQVIAEAIELALAGDKGTVIPLRPDE